MMGLRMQEGQQTLQENDLKIQAAKKALQVQDRIMQHFASTGPDDKQTPSDAIGHLTNDLTWVAQTQLESGQTEAARQSLATVSTARRNQAYIDKTQSDTQTRNLTLIHNLISPDTVTDQKSFNDAQDRIALETGHQSPYKGKQYTPELVKSIHDAAIQSKDAALIQERISTAKRAEAQAAESEFRTKNLLPAQVRNTEARTTHLEKTGDKELVPTSTDVQRISDLAQQDLGPGMLDPSTLRAASLSVAEHAKSLIVKQHMDPDEAYKKAYTEARRNGVFSDLEKPKNPPGSSMNAPRTVPKGATAKQLKPNDWYILNDGTRAVWRLDAKHPDGTVGPGFVVPETAGAAGGGGGDESPSDDEPPTDEEP
jgi:hypothetical protein